MNFEDLAALILNNTTDRFFLVEIESNDVFRFVSVSPAYLTFNGFSNDKLVGKTPQEIFLTAAAEFLIGKIKEAINAKYKIVYEEKVEVSKGVITTETSLQAIYNEDDEAKYVFGVLREMNSLKLNEFIPKESNKVFNDIFNLSPTPMAISSYSSGEIVMVNESFAKTFGYKVAEVLGMKTSVFYADISLREKVLKEIQKNGKIKDMEILSKRSDGQTLDLLISTEVIVLNHQEMFLTCFTDITESKRIKNALTKSEDNLRTVFENTEIGYVLMDHHLNVRDFNKNADVYTIKEFIKPLEIGANFYSYFSTEYQTGLRPKLDKVLNGYNLESEFRTFLTNGSYSYYRVKYSPVLNKEKEVTDVLMSIEDISEQKKALLALEESEKKYQSLTEHALDGIFLLDNSLQFQHVNSAMCKMLGYTEKELLQMHLADLYPIDELQSRPLSVEYLKKNKVLLIERRWKRKDETELIVEINTRVLDESGYLNIARDITERKSAEKKLIESEQRLSYAMKATSDALWEWDYRTGKTYYSARWYEMLGYEDQELEMTIDTFQQLCHPDDLIQSFAFLNDMFHDPSSIGYSIEYRLKHKNGSWIWILGKGNVVKRDADLKPILISGTNSDITKRKKTEEELTKTVKELNDRNNEMMQFNYIVSHNLRAPIASILGLSNVINLPNTELDEKLRLTGHIHSAVVKMDDMIRDLNEILSYKSSLNKNKERVNINHILNNIYGLLQPQIVDSKAIIKTEIDQEAVEIFTIKAYLESILYNLINNAIKFKSSTRPLVLTISAHALENKIIFKISDNGIGMDMSVHSGNIFGLYKRFNFETEGKGLGLHMTKVQVEALGGTIEVESKLDQGTFFTITLPI